MDGIKYYEQILPSAFDGADLTDIIMQYNHEGRVLARLSNGTLIVERDQHGFLIYADLSKSQAAREMYDEISNGLVTKMSWAFTVAEDSFDRETRTRIIRKVKKVYDVSAVSIPANDGTDISARTFVNGEIEKEKQELRELNIQREIAKRRKQRGKLNETQRD